MSLREPVTIRADALAWMVAIEELGELHPVLGSAAHWSPTGEPGDRDRLTEQRLLFGPLDRRGGLDVEVRASLGVLCRARVEYYGWITTGSTTTGVLAAANGKEAMLAVRTGDSVRLRQIGPKRLAERLVAQAGDTAAARATPLAVTLAEFFAAADGRERTAAGVGVRQASQAVRMVRRIMALPLTGGGELHVAVRDDVGRYRRASRPLLFADTVHGRFLSQTEEEDGDSWIRVAPATAEDLVARLHGMRAVLDLPVSAP